MTSDLCAAGYSSLCSISRFCYWTRPFDIFNFTVPPIWQVHCTTGLMGSLRFDASLHSQEKRYILSFMLFIHLAIILLPEPWNLQERKITKPTVQCVITWCKATSSLLVLMHSVGQSVCQDLLCHFTNYLLFVECIYQEQCYLDINYMINSIY